MLNLFETVVELHKEAGNSKADAKKHIDYLVGALTDPLIVYPSAWAADISAPTLKWARDMVSLQRLALLMKKEYEIATDVECMLYMFPATMEAPISYEWTQIYLYVCTKSLQFVGREVPADIKVETLDKYFMSQLIELKRWIYARRTKHRRAREKSETRLPNTSDDMIKSGDAPQRGVIEDMVLVQGSFFQ